MVCVSEAEHQRGVDAGIQCRAVVLANSVDLTRFVPAPPSECAAARAALGVGDAPVAACIGRLAHQKGQDLLLAIWPDVRARVPGARLLLAGDGPERAHLEAAATDGVSFLGTLDDVGGVYAAADIVVTPSRWEGLSFVVLEALASGRSVVATDVDGMREAIGPGPDAPGVVVAPEDAAALTEAIAARLGDPELARREGAWARERATKFDLRAWGDELAAVTCGVEAG